MSENNPMGEARVRSHDPSGLTCQRDACEAAPRSYPDGAAIVGHPRGLPSAGIDIEEKRMECSASEQPFQRLSTQVLRQEISGKTLLLPKMSPFGTRLLAASFRAFGVDAVVMETYKGLSLGKELTSGKECFPCQVTLGDVLYHLLREKERLGTRFRPDRYVYFLPEADGPCRFGMYNKYQRLILDRFPDLRHVPIAYFSTDDGYTQGVLPRHKARYFRRVAYVATVIADAMERIQWRARPYEKKAGETDSLMEKAVTAMEDLIEKVGERRDFHKFLELLGDCAASARNLIDESRPRRPRIGLVGEIYLRTHTRSNQEIVRQIERFGGEVVVASIAEWVNYVTYDLLRRHKKGLVKAYRNRDHIQFRSILRQTLGTATESLYQTYRLKQVYGRVLRHMDIESDHSIRSIERWLDHDRYFSFDIGTEAALSIGGALAYIHEGFDGIVNVFPFTCMPSTICSAILKPLLNQSKVPYFDAPYDGTVQPNREVALRTFLYQARQHMEQRQNGGRPV